MNEDIRPPTPSFQSFQPGRDDQPAPQPEQPETQPPQKRRRLRWLTAMPAFWYRWSRRTRILVCLAVTFILAGAGAAVWTHSGHPGSANGIASPKTVKKSSQTVPSPLTGLQSDPALAKRPVTAIMIENSLDARPQSGLAEAGVVYEAIAEGGVTRFMALFQETAPQYIGPIRSLRPYYIDFAAPFQASIVHVGGSSDALAEVGNGSFRNLDEFANGNYFRRVSSRDAPHNVYSSFDELDKLNSSKGYTTSSFTPWSRKADAKLATPTAKTIDMPMSGPLYAVHYDYDPGTNAYLRKEAGDYHHSTGSEADKIGQVLHPKVVIAVVMNLTQGALDASGAYYSNYLDTGSGTVYIFQDGGVTQGTWTKANTNDMFKFTDSTGNPIKLNAGQTWVTAVTPGQVNYSP